MSRCRWGVDEPRLYGPMADVLKAAFGVEFELWYTGGGCTALVGELEGDIAVYLTDAPGTPNGLECTITDVATRRAVGEATVGFAVGVYRDQYHHFNIAYGEYPTAGIADLPVIVAEQLKAAINATPSHCPSCSYVAVRLPVKEREQ